MRNPTLAHGRQYKMAQVSITVNFSGLTASELKDFTAESFGFDHNALPSETKNQYNDRMWKTLVKGQVSLGRRNAKYKITDSELTDLIAE